MQGFTGGFTKNKTACKAFLHVPPEILFAYDYVYLL